MKTKPIEKITYQSDEPYMELYTKLNEIIEATNTNTSRIEDLASKGNIKFVEGKK